MNILLVRAVIRYHSSIRYLCNSCECQNALFCWLLPNIIKKSLDRPELLKIHIYIYDAKLTFTLSIYWVDNSQKQFFILKFFLFINSLFFLLWVIQVFVNLKLLFMHLLMSRQLIAFTLHPSPKVHVILSLNLNCLDLRRYE